MAGRFVPSGRAGESYWIFLPHGFPDQMKILRKFLVDLIKDVILLFPIIVLRNLYERSCASEQLAQKTLRLAYRDKAASGGPALDFSEVGFRCYSQNDEDGIILYIFSVIGETNKRCIEICAGDGFQCNTANLLLNHGWEGLLIDGDPGNVRRGRKFFRWDLRTRRWQHQAGRGTQRSGTRDGPRPRRQPVLRR